MTKAELVALIRRRKSFLCVGLDIDLGKMPGWLSETEEGWFTFNKTIIDATRDLCVAYKPNWAFYEALGLPGMRLLEKTIEYIGDDHLIIADAKRGDIGNTSNKYSSAILDTYGCDAITLAPYMGHDSLMPFKRPGKWLVILALTSNAGSHDFQELKLADGRMLYEEIITQCTKMFSSEEGMFVVGATHPDRLRHIRSICPDHFFLVPGVGAQGGDLESVCKAGLNGDVGLLVNSSRGIIYAGEQDANYIDQVRRSAQSLQMVMQKFVTP